MEASKLAGGADVRVSLLGEGIETRIDAVCRKIGGRASAASAAGVSDDMLRRYIRGESKPSFEAMMKLAHAAGVSLDWIASGGEGDASALSHPEADSDANDANDSLLNETDFVYVPRYNVDVAAGFGSVVCCETPSSVIPFPRTAIETHMRGDARELSVLSVKGDSMEGVLNHGDAVLVNHSDKLMSAGIYVVRMDGELIVKRVQRLPGGVLKMSSANEAYEPFTVHLGSLPPDFEVIGRVVWFGRWV